MTVKKLNATTFYTPKKGNGMGFNKLVNQKAKLIGEAIRKKRKEKRLSVARLAEIGHLSNQSVYFLENGKQLYATIRTLMLLKHLEIDPYEILASESFDSVSEVE